MTLRPWETYDLIMVRQIRRAIFVGCLFLALAAAVAGSGKTVYIIDFNDIVHGISAEFIVEGIKQANAEGAELVVIKMQTPGGLMDSMEEIIKAILASEVPVVGYVTPSGSKAASAGFYILMACDVAVMAPGTRTGAATPVLMTGAESDNETYRTLIAKAKGDSKAYIRALVQGRVRLSMVPETGTAEEKQAAVAKAKEIAVEQALRAIDESEAFENEEALRYGLIDFTADSVDDLLATLDGRKIRRFGFDEEKAKYTEALDTEGSPVVTFEMDIRQQFLSYLSNPVVALLLGTIGIIGIYIEFSNPGLILPGSVGVICLILAAISFQILPVNWAALLLIGVAIFLFVLEFKIASYGLLTIGGIVCLIFGGLMLFEGPIPEMRLQLWQVIPFALAFALITLFLLRLVIKAHLGKVATGTQGLVGETGVFKGGKVFVHGELWSVSNKEGFDDGDRVVVQEMRGFELFVKKAEGK